MWKFQFITFCSHITQKLYSIYTWSTYQKTALLSEMFLFWFRATCKLQLVSYSSKHASWSLFIKVSSTQQKLEIKTKKSLTSQLLCWSSWSVSDFFFLISSFCWMEDTLMDRTIDQQRNSLLQYHGLFLICHFGHIWIREGETKIEHVIVRSRRDKMQEYSQQSEISCHFKAQSPSINKWMSLMCHWAERSQNIWHCISWLITSSDHE